MSEIYEHSCYSKGKVDSFVRAVDLKEFLKDLHAALRKEGFIDDVKANLPAKKGEWLDGGDSRRIPDMFEYEYSWSDYGSYVDFEIKWIAKSKTPHSQYGEIKFSLDLVCRVLKQVEILEGDKKKKLQHGKWEFRNKFIYTNTVKEELNKLWIYKMFPSLKDIYFKHMYDKIIASDIHFCEEKVVGLVYGVIRKHFT